ncbi:MAG: CCA tRNA nucleotidyltransferase [Anaerotignaceae bacterium]
MNIINLPKDVAFILNKLKNEGFEGYIVGGCVRDSIMGITPHDWDITTSATPQEVKEIFNHTVDTGIDHGTVTVVMNKNNYELTTYRVDGEYKDCRHPSNISFTRDLHEDLLRRDFTINAIAYNNEDGYVDIFGGIEDINKKIIKGVGVASERFQEDALRMLRAVRFGVQLDFEIEENTLKALMENVDLIKKISVERIREELTKSITGNFIDRLPILWQSGLLGCIDQNLSASINEKEVINNLKNNEKNVATAYALLLQFVDFKKAKAILDGLKFDTKTQRLCETLLRNFNLEILENPIFVRKTASRLSVDTTIELLKLKEIKGDPTAIKARQILFNVIENKDCLFVKDLKINGGDLKQLGIPQGKELGDTLNYLLEKVLEEPSLNEETLLKELVLNKI